ncbi:MAG: ABC transporter ATP-binding protein [Pirellula sp.]|nr:ABC transporter ATP-binding protein [Pirellula sp.]
MFQLQNVSKTYTRRSSEVLALRTESLEIADGEYAAILGPSGSGKTTLLSILGGMLSPNSGSVSVDGISLYDMSPTRRAEFRRERMGFVFQTFNLVPYLTAQENVQIPLYLTGQSPAKQRARSGELLERMGLADRLDHKPSELSTGQQQRVALARTLANDPRIVLADEPTGNLDPDSRRIVLDFLDELHGEGRTIVMVTHDAVAAQRARTWLRLESGTVRQSADPSAKAA